jgi:parvulin-like peptidyl-prolyl isomerase
MKLIRNLLAAAALASAAPAIGADLINGIQAVVHDSVITAWDVIDYSERAEKELFRDYRRQPAILEQKIIEVRRDSTEHLLERQLILQEFKAANLAVPQKYIDDEVQRRIRSYGDRMVLIKSLEAEGTTFDKFRQRLRNQIVESLMRRSKVSPEKIIISPHKIELYYQEHLASYKLEDRVKLRMIVVNKPTSGDPTAALKTTEEALAKVKAGGDFAELAKLYSQGTQRAEGGLFGWADRAALRKDLAEQAFALKAGQHSDIIDAPDAYYVLRADEAEPAHYVPLGEVRGQIEKDLLDSERTRLEQQWIEKLKKKTFWRLF